MFENPGRQASKKFYNKSSENSRSQIVFRTDILQKLTLGAPDEWNGVWTGPYQPKSCLWTKNEKNLFFNSCHEIKILVDFSWPSLLKAECLYCGFQKHANSEVQKPP